MTDREKFRVRESMLMDLGVVETPADLPEEIDERADEKTKAGALEYWCRIAAERMALIKELRKQLADAQPEEVTEEEWRRVCGSWITQPGAEECDPELYVLGMALEYAGLERAHIYKAAFPDEWEKWDVAFERLEDE